MPDNSGNIIREIKRLLSLLSDCSSTVLDSDIKAVNQSIIELSNKTDSGHCPQQTLFDEYAGSDIKSDAQIFSLEANYNNALDYARQSENSDSSLNFDSYKEIKLLRESLEESEEKYKTVINQSKDNIYLANLESKKIIQSNSALQELLGYTEDELHEMTVYDFINHPPTNINVQLNRLLQSGGIKLSRRQYLKKNNEVVDVEISGGIIQYKGLPALCIVSRDISSKIASKKALRESRNKIAAIIDALPESVYLLNRNGQILETLSAESSITSDDSLYLKGKFVESVFSEDAAVKIFDAVGRSVRTGNIQVIEYTHENSDGIRFFEGRFSALKSSKENFASKVIFVNVDISSGKKNELEIIKQKEKAESANIAKSEFLANVSHELRTPLNPIAGFTKILLNDFNFDNDAREILKIILSSSDKMTSIICNMLDMSAFDSGSFSINYSQFSFRMFFGSTLNPLKSLAEQNYLTLLKNRESKIPDNLIGDEARLKRILTHLVENAVKFSDKKNGQIIITAKLCDENEILSIKPIVSDKFVCIHFTVSDQGIGIHKDNLQSIFDMFAQADASSTRQYGGTGLGLSIVKKLIEKMDGKIYIESKQGEGTDVHFILPFDLAENYSDQSDGSSFSINHN